MTAAKNRNKNGYGKRCWRRRVRTSAAATDINAIAFRRMTDPTCAFDVRLVSSDGIVSCSMRTFHHWGASARFAAEQQERDEICPGSFEDIFIHPLRIPYKACDRAPTK